MLLCSTILLLARDWNEIKKSGYINIGIRNTGSMLIYNSSNTNNKGMNYDLATSFAKYHNLKAKFIIVSSFADYWKYNGNILLKNNTIVTPDIYKNIDFAAEIFTVTKRRKELINMYPYLDNIELLFGSNKLNIKSYKDIIGKRVLAWESMSFSKILTSQMKLKNIPYKITYVDYQNNKLILPRNYMVQNDIVNLYLFPIGTKVIGKSAYHLIASNLADIGIIDAPSLLINLSSKSYNRDNLKPFIPAQQKKSELAWGSAKKNKILNKKIKEFIQYDKKSVDFSKRFYKYFNMTLDEYNQLINMIQ